MRDHGDRSIMERGTKNAESLNRSPIIHYTLSSGMSLSHCVNNGKEYGKEYNYS